ncbi:methionyl-tRNA formyltransferase [soil metagenome]
MKKTSKTVVFFGSGPVAAQSLRLLLEDFTIEAVITKPKPEHHRGEPPVLSICKEFNLAVYTPTSKKELSHLFTQTTFLSQIGLVIDYGIIIGKDVIDAFSLGIVNSHFSLLPEWRGADPISFAILSGQKQTGISLMLIDEKMDEGPLIAQATYNISPTETTPELTENLIELSHKTLQEILPIYIEGLIESAPQSQINIAENTTPTYSRKLNKTDGIISWEKPAEDVEREIRAYIEWPKSRTTIANKDVIITSSNVIKIQGEPSTFVIQGKKLIAYCGKDALEIITLKPAGKKEMTSKSFIAGHHI